MVPMRERNRRVRRKEKMMATLKEEEKKENGSWKKKRRKKEKKRKERKKERWGRNEMNGLETSTYPKKGIKIMKLPIYPYVKI